jgi:uncharacterized membrane protein YgcG
MRKARLTTFLLLALVLLMASATAFAQERSVYWETYDVDLTIQPDGSLRVAESQQLEFVGGPFRYGLRTIPTDALSGIRDVRVSEVGGPVYAESNSDQPNTFQTYTDSEGFNIRYNFEPTSNAGRHMLLEYTVDGALLYYDGGDQLVWKAVPANPNFPIQSSSVTVNLPPGATLDNYDATGPAGSPELFDGGVRFFASEPIRPGGEDFAVRVQWPHGIVAGQPSAWQAEIDQQERVGPLADLGALGLTALAAIGGLLALLVLWYNTGRDAPTKLPAEWIPEPPSDLPAGMVGTLVDERADTKDVIASLVDLARRGVLAIQDESTPGVFGLGEKHDFVYHLEDAALPMRPYEKHLVDKLFGDGTEKRQSDLSEKFYTHLEQTKKQLYSAVVEEGYFPASPERTRTTFSLLGVAALVAVAVLGCVALVAFGAFTGFAICVPVGLAVPAVGLLILARYMPRKSAKGSEEAAKWLAFKRYMENIEQYTKVDEVKEIFDRYLPYAIAFGLEKSWIQKFSRIDTAPPPWFYPGPYMGPRPRRYVWWGGAPYAPMGGGMSPSEGGGQAPSLSDMSRGMGASLASMSAGLGSMLSSASNTLSSRPAPQAGSGSWGSRSWSGGGGFSGGGWSGGGGFSGGGGGGSSFG